jgi:hypothetical protein
VIAAGVAALCGLPGPAGLAAQMACYHAAQAEAAEPGDRPLRGEVAVLEGQAAARPAERRGHLYCRIAELKKRLGSPDAARFYRLAIAAEPANAEYHWLFGDYLRSFRGPLQPLFAQAEAQYYAALRAIPPEARTCAQTELFCYLRRSLIALYERDGLPLLRSIEEGRPIAFAGGHLGVERRTAAIGEFDDVRDFTSEALFASSRERLARPLTEAELSGMVRQKPALETTGRLRLRAGRLPAVDVFYQRRRVDHAQITNFYEPRGTNRFELDGYGVAVDAPVDAYPVLDLGVRAEVGRSTRQGLIEFVPAAREEVTSASVRGRAARFLGPDRLSLELTWAADWVRQQVETPIARRTVIAAPTLRLERFRGAPYERRVAPRGSELFVGAALATERFGSVDVHRRDYFGGVALRGMGGLTRRQSFDVTLQPTLFTSHRTGAGDPEALRNSQWRTFGTLLYRVSDHENEPDLRRLPALVFLNVRVSGSYDVAVHGPRHFQSRTVGAGMDAKVVLRGVRGGVTLLGSARYDLQQYWRLDRSFGSFVLDLEMGVSR